MLGAVRLTEAEDGIGIALFGFSDSNETYVAETDYDLRITNFAPIRPDEYPIDYSITKEARGAAVHIGDPCPIPYWIGNEPGLVHGDISIQEFEERFGDALRDDGVITDLREIIGRSRTQFYQKERQLDAQRQVLKDFEDIFDEYPVHSRYWVSRFKAAVLNAIQSDDSEQARSRLRGRILEWVKQFRHKTNLRLLSSALSSAQPHVLTLLEVKLVLFDYLAQRFSSRDVTSLRRPDVREVINQYFPMGLYGFITLDKPEILQVLGGSGAEFAYDALWSGSRINLVSQLLRMFPESENGDFHDVIVASSVIFGSSELPDEVFERVHDAYSRKLFDLEQNINYAYRLIFRDKLLADQWAETAKELLLGIEEVNGLLRLREGAYRLSGKIPVDERPIASKVVEELRAYTATRTSAR
ncbi:hypothetical protein BCCGELA001_05195 [Bradyrhizobium sp. CCGE-LA001]|nr:hypothetical protein BCCGELA001_05195 [Bradyrhizobium sp. CCGE-LA001]